MAAKILPVLCCLFALTQITAGSLVLDIYPAEIYPGLTQSLTINCTFSFDGHSDIVSLISLIISKQNQQEQFEDLVSISIFTPNQITETARLSGSSTLSGHISPDDQSFLSIHWSSTTASESGLYRCEASGVNSSGRPAQSSLTRMVTSRTVGSQTPCCDQLTDIQHQLDGQDTLMQIFQRQLDLLETLIQNQSHTIDKLLSLIQGQSAMLSSQSNKITDIQTKLLSHMVLANDTFIISTAYQGHYYLLSKTRYQASKLSEETCEAYGGYLVEINDSDEQEFVEGFLYSQGGFHVVVISGTREGHPDRWTYTHSGAPLTFTNWHPGGQDTPTYFCISMSRGSGWRWSDYECTISHSPPAIIIDGFRFMCEVNIN